jgi:signal transduction histidine kinase
MGKQTSRLWDKLEALGRWSGPAWSFLYRWIGRPLQRVLLHGSPVRTLAEALGFYILVLFLFSCMDQLDPNFFATTMLFPIIGTTPLWVCLRLRLNLDDWKQTLIRDAGTLLVLVPAMLGCLLVFWGIGGEHNVISYLSGYSFVGIGIVILLFFTLARMWVSVWATLGRLRHKHLRWAVTYAHLWVGVLIALPFLAPDESLGRLLSVALSQAGWAAPLIILLFPMFVLSQQAINLPLVLPLVLPPIVLFSYLITRRITRRLESLTEATTALGTGNYATRLTVEGEDEVAQLQANFNGMAERLESAMQALQDEQQRVKGLLQSNRELVASVSHELRTPVSILRGYLESALTSWQEEPPAGLRRDLEVMEREVTRLQTLIEDLFTVSRAEVGRLTFKCEPVEIAATVQHLVESVAPLAWQLNRVQVLAEVAPNLSPVLADEGRLTQILSNLLHNSIRHTPPGGIVVVSAAEQAQSICFQVCDTGEGIEPDVLPHIWERFFRVESARNGHDQGAGLGLALVKELTEAMRGSVQAESTPGQGSRFTISLPKG